MSFLQTVREFVSRVSTPIRPSIVKCEPAAASSTPSDEGQLQPASFTVYHVMGFKECPWYHRAACIVTDLQTSTPDEADHQFEVDLLVSDRSEFGAQLDRVSAKIPGMTGHNTCPAVLSTQCRRAKAGQPTEEGFPYQCDDPIFVGGYSALEQHLKNTYGFTSKKCAFGNAAANGCPVQK